MLQIRRFLSDEEGVTALEYGLLAALVGAAILLATTNLGQGVRQAFEFITAAMRAILTGGGGGS